MQDHTYRRERRKTRPDGVNSESFLILKNSSSMVLEEIAKQKSATNAYIHHLCVDRTLLFLQS